MGGKREKPEDIVLQLRQVEVLQGQGKDSGTYPNSSMISRLYLLSCFCSRRRRFSSWASRSSCTNADAVMTPTVRPF